MPARFLVHAARSLVHAVALPGPMAARTPASTMPPSPARSRAPYYSLKRYFGEVADPNSEGPSEQTRASNGGTADSMDAWTESEETFTQRDEFFADTGDFESFEEEDDDELGEGSEEVDALGRRHVRRSAPEGTEQILENEAPRRSGLPDSIERWRQRSATGAVLTAFAFGLQSVFEPERKEPAIVMQTSGDPPMDLPVEAQLEQLGPRQSTVSVRPWLLPGGERGTEQPADEAPGAGEAGQE